MFEDRIPVNITVDWDWVKRELKVVASDSSLRSDIAAFFGFPSGATILPVLSSSQQCLGEFNISAQDLNFRFDNLPFNISTVQVEEIVKNNRQAIEDNLNAAFNRNKQNALLLQLESLFGVNITSINFIDALLGNLSSTTISTVRSVS